MTASLRSWPLLLLLSLALAGCPADDDDDSASIPDDDDAVADDDDDGGDDDDAVDDDDVADDDDAADDDDSAAGDDDDAADDDDSASGDDDDVADDDDSATGDDDDDSATGDDDDVADDDDSATGDDDDSATSDDDDSATGDDDDSATSDDDDSATGDDDDSAAGDDDDSAADPDLELCALPGQTPTDAGWAVNLSMPAGSFGDGDPTTNAGGSGGITAPAWGLWASAGGTSQATYDFGAPLLPGQSASIEVDNGFINNPGSVGVAFGFNGADGTSFFFLGGGTTWQISDAGIVVTDSGLGFTPDGFELELTQLAGGQYELAFNGNLVHTGQLSFGAQQISEVRVVDAGAGGGPTDWDVFFNCLRVDR